MTAWSVLLIKELREIVRDPRALLAGFGLAFLAPVVIYAGLSYAIDRAADEPPAYVLIEGAAYAPNLVMALSDARLLPLEEAPEDAREHWQSQAITLRIPSDFSEAIAAGKTLEFVIEGRLNDDAGGTVVRRLRNVLQSYGGELAQRRLLLRGIDLNLLRPVNIELRDTSPPENNVGRMSLMIVMYVMMAAFFSALSPAIDSSAGERERNMLEVLLCQPVRRIDIVAAKLSASFLVAMLGVTLTLSLTAFSMGQVDLAKAGMAFSLSPWVFLAALLAIAPVALFASALILLVAFFARSFKEAQSQVTLVIMLPALGPMAMMFMQGRPTILNWLPITGQYLYLERVLKGGALFETEIVSTSALTVLLAIVLALATAWHLRSEKSVNAL